jgi:hypothetical protein
MVMVVVVVVHGSQLHTLRHQLLGAGQGPRLLSHLRVFKYR